MKLEENSLEIDGGENFCKGMIISGHKDRYEVMVDDSCIYLGRLKPSVYYRNPQAVFPTVGDEVVFENIMSGDVIIVETMPRRSCFFRANPTQGLPDQAVAANFDYVFLVMSLNRDFHIGKLTRYLAAASKAGGTAVLLLSKTDLITEQELKECVEQVAYLAPKLMVLPVSTYSSEGMEQLRSLLPGKKAVFLGASGVGKSSLVNALMGEEVMETGDIREADSQGRHTTTSRQCFFMPNGGILMDTPGMRKIMMSRAEGDFSDIFEEVERLMSSCKFRNCTHKNEPGCAVREALENGSLDERQYKEYLQLLMEESRAKGREQHRLKRLSRPGKYGKKDRKWKEGE